MTTVKEIEKAVSHLPESRLKEFRTWFEEFDATNWDAQIDTDAKSGKLDHLANDALSEFEEGKCTPL